MDLGTIAPHTRLTGPERQRVSNQLRWAYLDGASIRQLADETGRSYGFVHAILSEAGVPLRARGYNAGQARDA